MKAVMVEGVVKERGRPVSSSVRLMRYSVMMPFRESSGGGLQEI